MPAPKKPAPEIAKSHYAGTGTFERSYELLMHAPAAVAVISGPELRFELANPNYLKLVGSKKPLEGMTLQEAIPGLEPNLLKIVKKVAFGGERFVADELPVTLDWDSNGQAYTKYLNLVYEPLFDQEGNSDGLMAFAYEITGQVLARQLIAEREEEYRSLFNSIDQGFCVLEMLFDGQETAVDYRFIEVNTVFEKQTGLKQAAGKTAKELIPGLENHWFEAYGGVALTGKPIRFENGSDEMGRWFDVYASRIGGKASRKVAVLFTDITERKRQHSQLLESEAYFRHMTDNTPVMTWITDRKGQCTYLNQKWYDYTGQSQQKAMGIGWLSVVHPDDAANSGRIFNAANRKRIAFNLEYRLRSANGTYRWMLDSGQPRFDERQQFEGFIGSVTDIHERKSAEEALKNSEDRFRTLVEQSTDAMQMLGADGSSLYASDSVTNVVGYSPEELNGMTIDPFIFPDDRQAFLKAWQDVKAKPGRRLTVQYRVRHKNGAWVWLETTLTNRLDMPNINAVIGNFRNITERRQTEERLRESEERFRFMAESMPQKVFTVHHDGSLTYFNPQWQKYTGITAVTLVHDQSARESIVHPDDYASVQKAWSTAFKKTEAAEYEYRMKGKDGQYRWHIGRMNPMRDENGNLIMWVGSVTDIHDMKTATERRYELEVEAATLTEQRSQLLALNQAKDEFISLASHQLRTPATGVKQYLGMLLEGYAGKLNRDQIAFLETAYESNERQINIVNDLLQVARIDAGKVTLRHEKTDLVRLVKNVINEHASRFTERQQTVILKARSDKVVVEADTDRIRMVLDNIIDNASKYTTDGKKISITVRLGTARAFVAIADEGVGMAADDMNRIFQKFSRLENPHAKGVEGSGLGLYWAKKIVDLHHGAIRVKSEAGHGTTFTISLPISYKKLV